MSRAPTAAGVTPPARRGDVVGDDAGKLGRLEGARSLVLLLAQRGVHTVALHLDSRGCDGELPAVEVTVRGAPAVPQLKEDRSALRVHRVGSDVHVFGRVSRRAASSQGR